MVSVATHSLAGCSSTRYERTTGEYIDDKIIASRVSAALANSAEYKFEDVIVASHQGTVQLSGFVPTGNQKTRAAQSLKKWPESKTSKTILRCGNRVPQS